MLFPDTNTIKHKRAELNITQKQLSQASGVSQSLIAKIESKKVSPSYEIIKRIFETFERLEHKKEDLCVKLLGKKLISINSKAKVSQAAETMKKHAISQLPVIDNNRLVGTISESTIYNKILEGGDKTNLLSQHVKTVMEDPLPTISAQTPKSVAMPLLKTNSAILLTERDKIIGILTKEDFIAKS
ncbi:MAG: CBS domain-containing protein [Nanoarchaeota archaeon]|nr:CBS domain-containing protein [Nanoarchaeota archaeon]MBU4086543.1 CBS domain-containing protein [Nanoarchaeota archaeon]